MKGIIHQPGPHCLPEHKGRCLIILLTTKSECLTQEVPIFPPQHAPPVMSAEFCFSYDAFLSKWATLVTNVRPYFPKQIALLEFFAIYLQRHEVVR